MPLQYIKVEVSDYIATVVMDRPPVNAHGGVVAHRGCQGGAARVRRKAQARVQGTLRTGMRAEG